MKKHLLFTAALIIASAASAQTVTWTCASNDAVTYPAKTTAPVLTIPAATVDGSTTITGTASFSSTTGIIGLQTTYKDKDGTAQHFFADDATKGYLKFGSVADKTNPKTNYVDFTVEQTDNDANLDLNTITFDITRLGTDAVYANFELLTDDGNGSVETGEIMNADNWKNYADGESWATITSNADGSITEIGQAYQAIREDLSKATNTVGSTNPYNKITISVKDLPKWNKDNYKVTLRVYGWGGGTTKGFLVDNVTFYCGTSTNINNIKAANDSENGTRYNAAGQRVNANYKGLVIENGKKFINK